MNMKTTTEEYIVLPGPEDIAVFPPNGIYQQSVTLIARMWPPVEAGPSTTRLWGIPAVFWGIFIGCAIVLILVLATLFFCCWLLPKRRKILSPTRYTNNNTQANGRNIIMAHHASIVAKPWNDSNNYNIPKTNGVPPQYIAPPQSYASYHTSPNPISSNGHSSNQNINQPEIHKSMWAVNPLYASSSVLSESDASYRTRSLPSWGKGGKQRPVSTTDDLEELYAKVNFTKKRRNRMRNDEAAIIALCRSRSQNLASLQLEREGIVVYDERTAL